MGFVKKTLLGNYIITDPQIILTVADSGKMEVNFAPWIPYAKEYKFKIDKSDLEKLAIEWSVTRGSRSGRVAWQFIQDLAGKLKIKINY